jgi:hypothetical protein
MFQLLQSYVAVSVLMLRVASVLSECCIFHTYVISVCSRCFICCIQVWVIWIPSIIIFEVWIYAITIHLFTITILSLAYPCHFLRSPCMWAHLQARMPTRTCIDVQSLAPSLERVRPRQRSARRGGRREKRSGSARP